MNWISVKDRLPEPEVEVLALGLKCGRLHNNEYLIAWIDEYGKWTTWEKSDYENNPDYFSIWFWMPLPELPKVL